MNKVILIGRLGQDPEASYLPTGTAVSKVSLATTEKWADKDGKKQESTEWHRLVMFGKTAQLANQYLKKGGMLAVEGKNATRSWEGDDGKKHYITEVKVDKMEFISTGQQSSQKASDSQARFTTDDIAF